MTTVGGHRCQAGVRVKGWRSIRGSLLSLPPHSTSLDAPSQPGFCFTSHCPCLKSQRKFKDHLLGIPWGGFQICTQITSLPHKGSDALDMGPNPGTCILNHVLCARTSTLFPADALSPLTSLRDGGDSRISMHPGPLRWLGRHPQAGVLSWDENFGDRLVRGDLLTSTPDFLFEIFSCWNTLWTSLLC